MEHTRWGILPALMCGFVAYRMDTPVSESEAPGQAGYGRCVAFYRLGLGRRYYHALCDRRHDYPGNKSALYPGRHSFFYARFVGGFGQFQDREAE